MQGGVLCQKDTDNSDMILALDFFRSNPPESKKFLDVGAFNGVTFRYTRLLFENCWAGTCIEACQKNYDKLESLNQGKGVVTIRAAATDHVGEIKLNVAAIPRAKEWGFEVSSLTTDAIYRWPDYNWEQEVVPASTVDQVLESNHLSHIDFASIDVEGQEKAVIRMFDLDKYSPHLLFVEYSNKNERRALIDLFHKRGYFLWSDNGQDIFVVRGLKMAHLKILFKGWWHQLERMLKNAL
jgi:FkbM family methyltransferase